MNKNLQNNKIILIKIYISKKIFKTKIVINKCSIITKNINNNINRNNIIIYNKNNNYNKCKYK